MSNNQHKSQSLTAFQVTYLEGRANYRLLFGDVEKQLRLDRFRSQILISPNKTVGYLRWRANEFGTQTWRVFIVKTAMVGDKLIKIPGAIPGGKPLLTTRGATYSRWFLKYFDALKRQNLALEDIPDSYWRQLHLRLHLKQSVHEISKDQWAAGTVKEKLSC